MLALTTMLARRSPFLTRKLVASAKGTLADLAPETLAKETTPAEQEEQRYRQDCYAQEGEDLVVTRIFERKRDGFYVDVGAHHPIRFSNTYLLYRAGWRGINIDATPGSMEPFRALRPRDINLECLVASSEASRAFYTLNEPALNTVSEQLAEHRTQEDAVYKRTGVIRLEARRLDSIFDEHLPSGQSIDLLNIDVEDSDLDVLRSNDWNRYCPEMILVEVLGTDVLGTDEISTYVVSQGYQMRAKFYHSALFERCSTK
jgi:FkbM family methyltransferase